MYRQAMKSAALLFSRPFLVIALLVPFLAGCGSAGLKTLSGVSPREDYQAFLRSKIKVDEAFSLKTLSSALIVKTLVYSQDVEARAGLLFQGDPAFRRETSGWKGAAPGPYGSGVAVLMGLFAPDLGEKDLAEGRFRPVLKTAGGRIIKAAEVKPFGRDSAFVRDYFPAFNPWEEVFLVQFNLPDVSADYASPYEFILEWPGGVQTLPLEQPAILQSGF